VTRRAVVLALCLGLPGAVIPGCHRAPAAVTSEAGAAALAIVRPDTEGLLLTWIDDKGDFHVETRAADVPLMGRDTVRVMDPNAAAPTAGDSVVVADFRQVGADGAYPVRTMLRTDFEGLALARRKEKGPTLAGPSPSSQPSSEANGTNEPAAADAPVKPANRTVVIIYGAEWCGACHDAARYLRRKGVPFVEKDIEKDAAADREMREKLAKHGFRGGSIPVIDVRGKVMVGFDPGSIDAALGQAS
jgi:glutaredoxin